MYAIVAPHDAIYKLSSVSHGVNFNIPVFGCVIINVIIVEKLKGLKEKINIKLFSEQTLNNSQLAGTIMY